MSTHEARPSTPQNSVPLTQGYTLPNFVRWAVGTASRVYPSGVLPWLERLFFTPIRVDYTARQKRFDADVERFSLSSGNAEISVYRCKADGPRLLFVHGWSGCGAQFHEMMLYFSQKGYDCWTFDAPGHGLSRRVATDMPAFARAAVDVARFSGGLYAVIGHSLGGMALHLAASEMMGLKHIITVCAPYSVDRVVQEFCARSGGGERMEALLMNRLKERYAAQAALFDPDVAFGRHGLSGLIIHDRDDPEVSYDNARDLVAHWKGSELFETRGLGHRKPLREGPVWEAIELHLKVTQPT
ncbi:alpha/beta fold hydrolase [bacterium]|nr:alpha/beta fold hydrolase [bacterium]